jgi:hypothetical protein
MHVEDKLYINTRIAMASYARSTGLIDFNMQGSVIVTPQSRNMSGNK